MKIHIDLDCFFVSAERTLDPSLLGKPVAIGGRGDPYIFSRNRSNQELLLDNGGAFVGSFFHRYQGDDLAQFVDPDGRVRGILTTASYEGRAYGIHTGMSIREALIRCPHLIIKGPNMGLYHRLSHQLYLFLQERIPFIEQASIDEFYGDLDGWIEDEEIPEYIDSLRHAIKRHLNLPVSIGAAHSKYIAKLATDTAKPFGCRTLYPSDVYPFIQTLSVSKFPGLGKTMTRLCNTYRIKTLGDLLRAKPLVYSWGPYAQAIYERVRGNDLGELILHPPRKSIGISRTFDPIDNRDEARRRIAILARHLAYAIKRLEVYPTTFTLSIHYLHHPRAHHSITETRLFNERRFRALSLESFASADLHPHSPINHLGLSASAFSAHTRRAFSLLDYETDAEAHAFDDATRKIRDKYGLDSLRWGNEL
ncbi:MAG: DNA polymerase IV [Sulfuricurvum sp.]|uniref:Y-family DNA polymerase n=1 Tax=Sulfuricurvum sp. TaxID=2025608 RepID=UPI00262D3E2C|nr:DNA polymerase IV [Sulfuricurvum sp.]MDD2838263.1 DNA polymerase IV [Sulfuricurvum sp.]MDD3597912.1 DNA polymerase IV [Sulfuricurvum sp.]